MRRRVLVAALGFALALLVLAAAFAIVRRHAWAEAAVVAAAWGSGVHPVSLRVESIGPRGAVARDLRIGETPDLVVDTVTLEWSLRDLVALRAGLAVLEGARLQATVGEEGLSVGALDPLLEGEGDGGDPLAARLRLVDASVHVETPAGAVRIEGVRAEIDPGSTATPSSGGEVSVERIQALDADEGFPVLEAGARAEPDGEGALAVSFHLASTDGRARVEGGGRVVPEPLEADLAVRLLPADLGAAGLDLVSYLPPGDPAVNEVEGIVDGEVQVRVPGPSGEPLEVRAEARLAGGAARVQTEQGALRIEALEARAVATQAGPTRVELLGATLRDGAKKERFAPVGLTGDASAAEDGAWQLTLSLADAAGHRLAGLEGVAVPEGGRFEGRVATEALTFGPDGLDAPALAPALGDSLASLSGELAGRAEIRVPGAGEAPFEIEGVLELDGIEVATTDDARLSGLRGDLDFAGPAPWRTRGVQQLRFAEFLAFGALSEGELTFQGRDLRWEVESFECGFASGRLRAMGAFDPEGAGHALTLELDGVDLADVLDVLEVPDLTGTGTVSGVVPVWTEGDALRVGAALQASEGGGVLRYTPASGAAERLGVAGDLGLLAKALEDFHYHELSLGLEGDLAGDAALRARLHGRNPNVEGGRPIHLNLRVETHVPSLLLGASASTRLPQVLVQRLRDRVEDR